MADVIAQGFPAFDHRGTIVEPFDTETKRDGEFQDKLNNMVVELMLEFHAWSTSRPSHESDRTADILEKDINGIMETEREQGMSSSSPTFRSCIVEKTRQRLNEFVNRIKMALAALTGL